MTSHCSGTVTARHNGEAFACELVDGHPGPHTALRARTFLVFDVRHQRVHLDRCECTYARADRDGIDNTVDLGGLDTLTRDEIAALIEDGGGPQQFSVAACVSALMS